MLILKIWNLFMECSYIPVLLWKRVLVSWGYILKTAIAVFGYFLFSYNTISMSKFNGLRDIRQITKCDQYDKLSNNS